MAGIKPRRFYIVWWVPKRGRHRGKRHRMTCNTKAWAMREMKEHRARRELARCFVYEFRQELRAAGKAAGR